MSKVLTVQSEIYEGDKFDNCEKSLNNENLLLRLNFLRESVTTPEVDEDGDLVVGRDPYNVIEIECSPSTSLQLVGLQLWRGAFLLADYILSHKTIFEEKNVLELGSGVGFTSIVAGVYAKHVISTDMDNDDILYLIKRNLDRNRALTKSNFAVLPLDFYEDSWSSEVQEAINSADVILAADVIYDNNLSEAFLKSLIRILDTPGKKIFYLALEKRYVFTIPDLNTVAPCYEFFLNILLKKSRRSPMAAWHIRQVPVDFAHSFKYDRTEHLVLWEIST